MSVLSVEIVFALTDTQSLQTLNVTSGSSVADVIAASAMAERFPQHDLAALDVGIWGHVVDRTHLVKDGDRVELYRPLQMNPRDARRQLAETGRTMSGKSSA